MARLTPSPLYRTDIAFGRYCAHPWVAITHLALAAGVAGYLHLRPAPELSPWVLLALAMVPGVWLVSASLSYGMLLALKLVAPADGAFGKALKGSWGEALCRREALAVAMALVLCHAGTTWAWNRPVDNADFQRCTQSMGAAGWKALATTLTPGGPREAFWSQCAAARAKDRAARLPAPRSLTELQQRYGAPAVAPD